MTFINFLDKKYKKSVVFVAALVLDKLYIIRV